jgi:hypothetical protein
MDISTMEKGEINDIAGKEVVMEDRDYANVMNMITKPKKRVAGEIGPGLSTEGTI